MSKILVCFIGTILLVVGTHCLKEELDIEFPFGKKDDIGLLLMIGSALTFAFLIIGGV